MFNRSGFDGDVEPGATATPEAGGAVVAEPSGVTTAGNPGTEGSAGVCAPISTGVSNHPRLQRNSRQTRIQRRKHLNLTRGDPDQKFLSLISGDDEVLPVAEGATLLDDDFALAPSGKESAGPTPFDHKPSAATCEHQRAHQQGPGSGSTFLDAGRHPSAFRDRLRINDGAGCPGHRFLRRRCTHRLRRLQNDAADYH